MKPLNQYESLPLTPGTRSDFTTPLILELFDKGQGKEVIELLYFVDLKVIETSKKPGFKLVEKRRKLNGKTE